MHVNGLTVRRFASPLGAARALARDIATCVTAHPDLVLGLPTGRTPMPLYRRLALLYRRGDVDFARATTFNLDEFVGVAPDDPHSYRAFMEREFFGRVNFDPRRIHFLDGTARDVEGECRAYERAIARAGGIDLVLLGLGRNGHIGFNEPADGLIATTHRVRLTPATRRSNAALFADRHHVPREALSMGMATILRAKRIVMLATGAAKADAVRKLVSGRITPRLPASFLQLHSCAEVWVDEAAAAGLTGRAR